MKKTLAILSCIFLVTLSGCCKGEDKPVDTTLSPAEQQAENAQLVGAWREMNVTIGRRNYFAFTEDFKFSHYSYFLLDGGETARMDNYTDEPYTIPEIGKIAFTKLYNNYRTYMISGGFLYIKDVFITKCEKIE